MAGSALLRVGLHWTRNRETDIMRHRSKKTARRVRACQEFRKQLVKEVGYCEVCAPKWTSWPLCCHEIARGTSRLLALDKRFAILVVCKHCHDVRIHGNEDWPEARQLAALKRSRLNDFDLKKYNRLKGRGENRITIEDVKEYEV